MSKPCRTEWRGYSVKMILPNGKEVLSTTLELRYEPAKERADSLNAVEEHGYRWLAVPVRVTVEEVPPP